MSRGSGAEPRSSAQRQPYEKSDVGFRAAHLRLQDAQKDSRGAPAYSRYVNRPLGRLLAAAAFQRHLTPDQVTIASAACSFAGIALLATFAPTWWLGLLVSAALVLGYALDAADGQLARLRGGGSAVGEWLDHMVDSAKITSLHLAVLVTAFRHFGLSSGWLLVPLVFVLVANVHFFGMILVDQLVRLHQSKHDVAAPPSRAAAHPLLMLLKVGIDYGFLCLVFVLLGSPRVFFGVYTVLMLGWTGYLLLALRKWRGDIASLRPGSGTVSRKS